MLKEEFVNNNIATRKKMFYSFCIAIGICLALTLYKYFFDPEGHPQERHYGRKSMVSFIMELSYTGSLAISILITVIGIFLIFYLKIILRMKVDSEQNFLEIECIERFKFKPVSKIMKLSETAIQIEELEGRERYSNNTTVRYSLHLTNKQFGHLKISESDFKNIKEVCDRFQLLKETAATKTRQMRLSRQKQGRRSVRVL